MMNKAMSAAVLASCLLSSMALSWPTCAMSEEEIQQDLPENDESNVTAEEAPESPWSLEISTGVFTSYMWRGFKVYDGAAVQPSIDLSFDTGAGVLGANGWMHFSADSDKTEERFTEFDGTLRYEIEAGPATVALGHLWYTYPHPWNRTSIPHTNEFFGSLSFALPVVPTLSVYEDYEEFHNQYYELALSHEFSRLWGPETSFALYASFGFASNAEKVYDENGLEQVTVGMLVTLPIGPFSLSPSVNYTFKVDEATINQFWSGMVMSYSF